MVGHWGGVPGWGDNVTFAVHYRVTLVVVDLGWVDFHVGHSTVGLVWPGQMVIGQNWPSIWAKWWNLEIKVNSTKIRDQRCHPVSLSALTPSLQNSSSKS